jgi:hypothetical protein
MFDSLSNIKTKVNTKMVENNEEVNHKTLN